MKTKQLPKAIITFFCVAIALSLTFTCAQAGAVKLKMATDVGSKDTPPGQSVSLWANLIEEKSNGEIKVDVFFGGELGGQQEVYDKLLMGDIDLMLHWPLTTYDKRMAVLYTPYMVEDWDDAINAYQPGGWLNRTLGEIFEKAGLKYMGSWPEGFVGVATRKTYATTPEAAKKIKVRVQPTFPASEIMQALGYKTATVDWGELYTAIQTGVVDGDSGNIIFWDYEYFRDVLDYFVFTKHWFITGQLNMNLDAWNRLSPEHQKIVMDTAGTVMEKQFKDAKVTDEHYHKKAEEAGIKVISLTKQEHETAMKTVRDKVWPMMEKYVGADIMAEIRKHATK